MPKLGRRFSVNSDSDKHLKNKHLTFYIEIDHPYQERCVLKNEDVFETMDLYRQLKNIIKT
jgi:hypothetical protein